MRSTTRQLVHTLSTALVLAALPGAAVAADWNNSGGNAQRNGLTSELGPDAQDLLWSGGRPSIIAWQPAIEGGRVFMVRQTGFPPGGEPNGSPVVAMNLDTGAELWARNVPFEPNDWTTWVAGARDGRVYAARSGNGASVSQKMYALNAATGATVWTSQDKTAAGMYDGVVFEPNTGDLIVADFRFITRIRASDGTTAWRVGRLGSVSGTCGAAIFGNAVYVADAAAGGTVIKRYNINTGGFQYQTPVMIGFTIQNTPYVGPDGTVYLARVQNNVLTDFLYAWTDTGAAFSAKWNVAARWSTSSEFGIGPDGSVYTLVPGDLIVRLDPNNGAVLNQFGPLPVDGNPPSTQLNSRMAIDSAGKVFYSNGLFTNGRLYSFNADLTLRWSEAVPNANIGTPSLGRDGTLIIAGVGTNVKAYRTPRPPCPGDADGDGDVDQDDLDLVLFYFGTTQPAGTNGDVDGDRDVDQDDLDLVLFNFGCP